MRHTLLLLLFCLACHISHAQPEIWKKQVSRLIDVRDSISHNSRSKDSSLFQLMMTAIRNKRLGAYSPLDKALVQKLFGERITEMYAQSNADSHGRFNRSHGVLDNADSVYRYRVFEDWTFNTVTGNITIDLKGIGPVRDVYGERGDYRGQQVLFVAGYSDVVHLIDRASNFRNQFWQSYFANAAKLLRSGEYKKATWKIKASRIIDTSGMSRMPMRSLRDESANDSNMAQYVFAAVAKGSITAWNDSSGLIGQVLSQEQLDKSTDIRIDTQTLEDPPTNELVVKYIRHDVSQFITDYQLLESWTYDGATGQITIIIDGVAPIFPLVGPICWVRYADMRKVLLAYEQYHPSATVPDLIWNKILLLDSKATMMK